MSHAPFAIGKPRTLLAAVIGTSEFGDPRRRGRRLE
jgi:hypothetical protein